MTREQFVQQLQTEPGMTEELFRDLYIFRCESGFIAVRLSAAERSGTVDLRTWKK